MSLIQPIQSVSHASLTVIVDNQADPIIKSSDQEKYCTDQPLLADHGFAVLIQLENRAKRILWDAGASPLTLPQNLRRTKIAPNCIYKVTLIHGHADHFRIN